jgi:segregation and condensation protein B
VTEFPENNEPAEDTLPEDTLPEGPHPEDARSPGEDHLSDGSDDFDPQADAPDEAAAARMPDRDPTLFAAPPMGEQERMVEAILFATAEPVTISELESRMPHGCDPAEALQYLRKRYEGRGVRVVRTGDAWAIRTAPDLGFLMQKETVETRKLSRAAIETLAIVSYHQPITRAEIEEIRGVSVSRGTVDQLIEPGWLRFGRRKMTPGRPVTVVVTQVFLDHFGLESARDLPGLKELRAAGLLDNRPPPGTGLASGEDEDDDADIDQSEMFEE